MPLPTKDCFGTVISNLNKMKECVRCELLAECRAINWPSHDHEQRPVVSRRPLPAAKESDPGLGTPGTGSRP